MVILRGRKTRNKQLNLIERHFLALCNILHTPLPNCVGVLRLLQEICIGNSSLNRSSVAERRKGEWQTDFPKMTIIVVYFSSFWSYKKTIHQLTFLTEKWGRLPWGKISHSRVCRQRVSVSLEAWSAGVPNPSLASARACIFRAIVRLFEIRDDLNSQSRPVYVFRTISLSVSHYILLYGHFLDALVWYSYCKGYVMLNIHCLNGIFSIVANATWN